MAMTIQVGCASAGVTLNWKIGTSFQVPLCAAAIVPRRRGGA